MQANPQVKDRKTMENIPLKMDLGFFIYTFNKYLNKGVNDSIFTHNVRLLIANTVKDIWVTEFHFDCSRPPLTLGCAN